ncbi:nucleotide sugar dehydrogenase [uncultured Rhodoblastus sp.]|uniref:nucleotide sugar dehydrogenase n=1 Tax=uncultured Rhodoblastus sp. TaxID=543037 RepID=UPI0025EE66D3|nr:nucleotide sugar dehydrogenase [uncultured Rhodoblastus sp.]
MKIAIYGLGYVGLTAAACLTSEGHWVLGVDVSERKVKEANSGKSPIQEPGLEDLLSKAVAGGLLHCTTDGSQQLNQCDLAIVCVGTPSGVDGSHNMTYIAEVSRQIATAVDPKRQTPLTVVYRSTIRPGTIEELIKPIFESTLGKNFSCIELVYNPEFLREAYAINDYFNPPKIVIGTVDSLPNPRMEELNKNIKAPVFYTKYRESEITKFVDNTFHAVKVAFANEIGRVCTQLGISASKMHEIFISDTKLNISPYYFRPGGAFGGSCLPKDVRALQYIAADVGANTRLIDALLRSNEAHKHFLYEQVTADLPPGGSVLMLGLAFKKESDDLRESPKVDMARKLLNAGYKLSIYDPYLHPQQLIGQNLGYSFLHLPTLPDLLVSAETIATQTYDVVVDMSGMAAGLTLNCGKLLNLDRLS